MELLWMRCDDDGYDDDVDVKMMVTMMIRMMVCHNGNGEREQLDR